MTATVAEELWTVAEAAARIRVHARTLRRRIAAGELPVVNVGSARRPRLRVAPSALAAWEKRRQVAGRPS